MLHTYIQTFCAVFIITISSSTLANRLAPPLEALSQTYTAIPNEPAEILEKRVSSIVDEDFNYRTSVYIAIRINDQTAIDDYSQINIHYNDHFETLSLDYANVLTLEGKTVAVKDDAVQIKTESSDTFYVDSKILAFSLPLTYSGSIIEYQYTISQKRPIIASAFFDSVSLNHWEQKASSRSYRSDHVHYSEYTLQAPASMNINFYTSNSFNVGYIKNRASDKNLHKWSIKDIASLSLQNYIPRELEISPRIKISTLEKWSSIREWASKLIEPKIDSSDLIKNIANNIKLKHTSKEQQLSAVFSYMQNNIRYVFAHVGRGGYEPHHTKDILSNGYGDCKDQSVLVISLLRELGINAYPALITTSNISPPNKKIPQINFDHMITYIPEQEGLIETWLDTVGGNLLFPGVGNTVNKQTALIISPNSNTLTTVNNTYSKPNLINLEINVAAPKNSLQKANFTFHFEGEIESNMRTWLRYAEDKQTAAKSFILAMYPNAVIEKIIFKNEESFEEEVSFTGQMSFSYDIKEPNSPFGFQAHTTRLANSLGLIPTLDNPADRFYPFLFDIDYTIKTTTTIEKPKNYTNNQQSSKETKSKNKQFTYFHLISEKNDVVKISQELVFHGIESTLEDYPSTYENIKSLDTKYWLVILSYDKRKSEIKKLENISSVEKTESQYIEHIQLLLDNGRHEKALKESQEAVKKHPTNGNIVYLKGLSHAYIGEDESAQTEFEKAESLGYEI